MDAISDIADCFFKYRCLKSHEIKVGVTTHTSHAVFQAIRLKEIIRIQKEDKFSPTRTNTDISADICAARVTCSGIKRTRESANERRSTTWEVSSSEPSSTTMCSQL